MAELAGYAILGHHAGLPEKKTDEPSCFVTLRDAAFLDVGTTAGNVAAGDDSRIVSALPKGGGTMTGDLTLKGDPTTALMPATKQYADKRGAPDAVLEDQKASGTDGGTFTSGAWRTRTLNTKVRDPAGLIALSANQFIPERG